MQREINLDGGEISVIKTLGLSGSPVAGKKLLEGVNEMEPVELADTLCSLMAQGYVLSSKVTVRDKEDIERASFRVNPSYSRDLRDALKPAGRRSEERTRRRRN